MSNRFHFLLTSICLAAFALSMPMAASAATAESPLSGPAYALADQAYQAYARRDYALAADKTREALRLRPDSRQLKALLKAALAGPQSSAVAVRHTPSPPSPAFAAADTAYKAFAAADYAAAIKSARQAVRLAPSNRQYWLLLVNALVAANRLGDAEQAIADGIAQAGNDDRLAAQRETVRGRLAEAPAAAAFAALARRDFEAAIGYARNAVALVPADVVYRMVLIDALQQTERFAEAEKTAGEAIALNGNDPSPLVMRAYAQQRLGRRAEARAGYELAVQQSRFSVRAQRNIRLLSADAAMAAGEPQLALELLQALPGAADDELVQRRRIAGAAVALTRPVGERPLTSVRFPPPAIDCRQADGPQRCAVTASAVRDPSYELATAAYKAFEDKDFARAAGDARRAVALSPANHDYQLLLVNALFRAGQHEEAEKAADVALSADSEDGALLAQRGFIRLKLGKDALARNDFDSALRLGRLPVATEIGLLAELGRKPEAARRFAAAMTGGELAGNSDVDIAYLAARVGDDEKALAAFNRADASGKLPNTAYQDAAFTAARARRDAQAIAYFKRSIDEANGLKLTMDPQLKFATRRAVAEVSREFGTIASLTYRGAVPGLGVAPGATGDTLQAGVETYWRPAGYRNGRYIELFARAFETVYNEGSGGSGAGTVQAALGIRYKPFSATNVVVSGSRVFSRSGRRQDWLTQLGYSGANGGDLRVDTPSWWTTRYAAEVGRYIQARQSYALAHVEAGRSMRIDGSDGNWVLFPHISAAADYDSVALERNSLGIGPGIGLRYWFRGDTYNAPRSYLEILLGYRFRLSGAERAEGVFLTTTLLY
jgi:tetratricopeptide (TPR) repeat protein